MRIDGAWRVCDDGITRPVVYGQVQAQDDTWVRVPFLVDSGADRTVFSEDILRLLRVQAASGAQTLAGVGGKVESILFSTAIRMLRETGEPVVFRGQFAAITDPTALDMSILGRDVTNLFAVIIDRPQDVVCLIGGHHRYEVTVHHSSNSYRKESFIRNAGRQEKMGWQIPAFLPSL